MTEYVSDCLAGFSSSTTECPFFPHVAFRHGAVIIQCIHCSFIYRLLAHHPTADGAMGKPSTLCRDEQTRQLSFVAR